MSSLMRLCTLVVCALAFFAGSAQAGVIVFSASTPQSPASQLFSISSTGKGLKQLTTGAHPADAPVFSPDGTRIAFDRLTVGIFTMNPNGSGVKRLTTDPRDSYPTWSPDGKQIAFVRPVGTVWRVFIMPATGGKPRPLNGAPPAGRPSWTSAGLLIPSGGDLLKISTANGGVLKYYNANIDAIWGLNSVALSPSISALTFIGARAPEPGDMECGEGPCPRFGLYLESLLSKKKKPTMIMKDAGPATFSPDGRQIVYVVGGKLVVRTVASGATRPISTGKAYPADLAPPAWR